MEEERSRDIDYAALAVKKALEEKFGRHNDLSALQVGADDRTIIVRDGPNSAEGTRDDLLAGIRKSATYADVWVQWRS